MTIEINGAQLHYQRQGSGKPVLLLHGWGANIQAMAPIANCLVRLGREAVSLDFPGFGESPEPPGPWGVPEYAACTRAFMEAIGIGVNLRELTWKDYLAALRSGYIDFDQEEPEIVMDMYLAEVALTGDWNILTLFSGDWEDDNTLNYGGWDNSELEELTEAYLGAKDDDRAQAVNDWLQLLTTTTVILPVCFETREVISHLGVISGMSPNQYDVFNNITAWTVNIG